MNKEFPELFNKMIGDELHVCYHAMKQKAKLLDHLENKQGDGQYEPQDYSQLPDHMKNSDSSNDSLDRDASLSGD